MTSLFARKKQQKTSLVVAECLLLLAGFLALGWAGYVTGQRLLANSWDQYRFEQSLDGKPSSVLGFARYLAQGARKHAEGEQPVAKLAKPAPRTRKLRTNDLIGKIEIPRVRMSAVVKEGAEEVTLRRAVGHVPYTALPGEKGNVGVAAHRDTFFRGLKHVRSGDTIRLTTPEGIYSYEVDEMKIVWPSNVEVLNPTKDQRITLVTCYPFNFVGHAPKRYIVQGKLTGFQELTAKSASPHPAL